jgi:hypothetical protein
MQTPTIQKLFWYLSGGHAKGMMFSYSLHQLIFDRVPLFAKLFAREFSVFLLVALYGFSRLRDRKLLILFVLAILGNVGYALNYRITDIYAYLLPSFLILSIMLALGWQDLFERLKWRSKTWLIPALIIMPALNLVLHQENIRVVRQDLAGPEIEKTLQLVDRDALIICPNSHHWHYFLYHLIAGAYVDRNIHIFPLASPSVIHDYIYDQKAFELFETRKTISPGLSVYFYDAKPTFRQVFDKENYELTAVAPYLFKVSARIQPDSIPGEE